jgi:hypothetical protein
MIARDTYVAIADPTRRRILDLLHRNGTLRPARSPIVLLPFRASEFRNIFAFFVTAVLSVSRGTEKPSFTRSEADHCGNCVMDGSQSSETCNVTASKRCARKWRASALSSQFYPCKSTFAAPAIVGTAVADERPIESLSGGYPVSRQRS